MLHVGLAWWVTQTGSHDDPRGLAMAYTVARSVKVVLAFALLAQILKGPSLRGQGSFVLQVIGATAAMGLVMHLIYQQIVAVRPMTGRVDGLIVFAACSLVGGVAYIGLAYLMRLPEISSAVSAVKGRLKRGK